MKDKILKFKLTYESVVSFNFIMDLLHQLGHNPLPLVFLALYL